MSGLHDLDEAVPSWDGWLEEFDQHLLPIFLKRGYTRDSAMIAFHLNCLINKATAVYEYLTNTSDDGEDWKRGKG